jgi:fatty-acyl-CoA synthase
MPNTLVTLYRTIRHGLPLLRIKPNSVFTMADLIEDTVRRREDHPFILFEGKSVSYGEYNRTANRIAHWGLEQGLQAGDIVGLLMQNRPEYLSVWAGLAKIGVTTALINTNLTGAALAHALDAAGTRRLIAGAELAESVELLDAALRESLDLWVASDPLTAQAPQSVGGRDFGAAIADQPDENPDPGERAGVRAGDPLVYIYTSGTTGLPKAAKMSHLRYAGTGIGALIGGLDANGVMYCALPLYHSAGGAMAVSAVLRSGGTLALRRKFSASAFWKDVHEMRATGFQYIGEFCRYLLNQPENLADCDHRLRFCIGNGLRPDIWEEFQNRFAIPHIIEFYGATEGNVAMVNLDGKVGSVGKRPPALVPAPRLVRYDIDADDHVRGPDGLCIECEDDEAGELLGEIPHDPNTSAGRFEGYTSKEATDKKVLRDVFERGDQWFRTGDLLRCDAKGYFYFVDRIGDTFRWKGENVSTQEVAEAVGSMSGVLMTNVYGVEIEGQDGRAGMAAIVLEGGGEFDGAALHGIVRDSLPAYAAPVFVRVQPEPEVTGTFKLRKVDLQAQGFDTSKISDPLFVRDDAAGAYLPLTPERLEALRSGELRV